MSSDAGGEVIIFGRRLSLSSQVIPIYQGMMPFMPIRLYKRHDLSKNKFSPSDMTLNSASTISIGSQHIAEKEEAKQGGGYNRLTRGFCSGNLPNENRCLQRSLWFYKGCNRFNKKVYYCRQIRRNFFETHHDSLVRLP